MPSTLSADEPRFLFEMKDVEFRVVQFSAREALSSPFEVDLILASEDEIEFDAVIGKEGLLTILGEEEDRCIHGLLKEFTQTGSRGPFYLYQARLVPTIWLLTLEQDCRIFQTKTVEEIVTQILEETAIPSDRFEFRLQNQYPPREYCVQYRETDLNFISRLLEEEGIFYFFEHSAEKHLLVFGDSTVNYQPIAGERNDEDKTEVGFHLADGMAPDTDFVRHFIFASQIQTGKVTIRDFNYEKPALDLTAQEEGDTHQMHEVYDYPGEFNDEGIGKNLAQIRLQEAVMSKEKAEGQSNCPRFIPGFTFNLTDHEREDFNQEYYFLEVYHTGQQPQVLEALASQEAGTSYNNDFVGIPASVTYRPERRTRKPIVEGVQTAIVVGPKGEEIYTDEYGRIKVQFHWDREGEMNEKSSCWIRVAQSLAGMGWGAIHIPRTGQEVIVDFLEGDPDRPIVIGSVYHATNEPPYDLPAEKTKSTLKTLSSPDGGGFNEIRFEDKKGEEQLFFHAEKNQDIRVKNDCFEWIGNNRNLVVKTDQKEHVENNRFEKVDADHMEEIGKDRHLKVKGKEAKAVDDSHSFTVKGDVIEVFKANHSEQVTNDYYLKGDNIVIEAMTNVTIKVGQSYVAIEAGGIKIGTTGQIMLEATNTVDVKGTAGVTVESPAQATLKGTAGVTVESPAQATLKSANTTVKGDAMATIQGGLVKIN
jgi:type VI secretion system secreted protein VgrG